MRISQLDLRKGFTIVELLIVISIIAILAAITTVLYEGGQHNASDVLVKTTVSDAYKKLQYYYIYNKNYPSNIANTDYSPPLTVAVALYTDASQTPVYQNLSPDQNAQLFLNSCNGFMPVTSGSTTYNTSCVFSGNNVHVKGTESSNVEVDGPTINQGDFALKCGSACTTAQNSIISTFIAQGGIFPVTVPKKGSNLPAPTMQNTGVASSFCVEGRSPTYVDIIYHAVPSSNTPESGPCPSNNSLHYP